MRFIRSLPRYLLAPVTGTVVVAICAGYVAQLVSGPWWREVDHVRHALAYSAREIAAGEWWRLLTVNLAHDPVPPELFAPGFAHLLNNLVPLAALGPAIERRLGALRYTALLVATSAAGSAFVLARNPPTIYAAGASIIVLGLIGAGFVQLLTAPRPWPMPWTVVAAVAGFAYVAHSIVGRAEITAVSHIGGLAAGLALAIVVAPTRSTTAAVVGVALTLAGVAVVVPTVSARIRRMDARVVAITPVGALASSVAVAAGDVHVGFDRSRQQPPVAVDVATGALGVGTEPPPTRTDLVVGDVRWQARGRSVVALAASSDDVVARIDLGSGYAYDLVAGPEDVVWIVDGPGRRLLGVDASTGRAEDEVRLGLVVPVAIDADRSSLWVADYWGGALLRVDLGETAASPFTRRPQRAVLERGGRCGSGTRHRACGSGRPPPDG